MRLRTKIITLTLLAGFLPFVTTGILSYRTMSLSLKKQAFDQLVSVREMKKRQIEDYFSTIRNQIQTFSEDKMIVDAMKEFKVAFNEFLDPNSTSASQLEGYRDSLRSYYTEDYANEYKKRNIGRSPDSENFLNQLDDESIALQYFYIITNNNQPGERHRLDFTDDKSTYSRLHGYYHPIIRNYLEKFGYYDIFLVDSDSGDIVYSVFKELDFSTSLKDGPYANTNLGRVFREVNDSNKQNYTRLIDFEPYPPSYEDAASFIASPIFDGSKKIGALIFQMPIDRINMVMTSNNDWKSVGLGESGETYLIGDDFTMRNQSRFIIEDRESYFEQVARFGMSQPILNTIKAKESTILLQRIETKGTKAAISGETGIEIFPDYRNVLVLSAYAPLDIEDVKWAIVSEIDKEEAFGPVMKLRNNILKITGVVGIFGILAIFLSIRITNPIKKLTEGTKKIAEGDLAFKIQTKAKDEIGYLTDSFNNMTSQLNESREQLENSRQKYTDLFDFAPVGYLTINKEGLITEANLTGASMFGMEQGLLIGRPLDEFIAGEYKDMYYSYRMQICEEEKHKNCELKMIKKDGTIFYARLECSLDLNEHYKQCRIIISDITERKQAERRLGAQHEITKVLAESTTLKEVSPKILQIICTALEWDLGEIWGYDRQSCMLKCSEIWHIPSVEVSEFEKITRQTTFSPGIGLPGSVLLSVKPVWIADVVHDKNCPRASVAAKDGLHGAFGFPILSGRDVLGTINFYSHEIRQPDKDLLNMMTAIGSQIGIFIKRKQSEEALLQSEKLKSIGTITSGVAHEFNNILAVISGNAQLLKTETVDTKELRDGLRIIHKATIDGADIVNNMLKFTKTEKDITNFESHDIRDLIKQSIDFTMPRWENEAQVKGINYHMVVENMREVPTILCNPSELREVFVNIINNAINAMPDGGSISFSTWSLKDTVFVSISDTGNGMTKEVQKKIFDPFFTTRRPEGTGLGMSTAYGIVTRHGGKIEVESEVGKGSTFILQFLISTKEVRSVATPESEQKTKSKSLHILVVDDDENICNILNKFLLRNGHKVKTVDNGADAIELLNNEHFDLALCDLAMPNVFGYEVIKVLNELEKRPKIGIITGWGEQLKPIDEEGLNVDFIIRKPFDFSELTKNINDAFGAE